MPNVCAEARASVTRPKEASAQRVARSLKRLVGTVFVSLCRIFAVSPGKPSAFIPPLNQARSAAVFNPKLQFPDNPAATCPPEAGSERAKRRNITESSLSQRYG